MEDSCFWLIFWHQWIIVKYKKEHFFVLVVQLNGMVSHRVLQMYMYLFNKLSLLKEIYTISIITWFGTLSYLIQIYKYTCTYVFNHKMITNIDIYSGFGCILFIHSLTVRQKHRQCLFIEIVPFCHFYAKPSVGPCNSLINSTDKCCLIHPILENKFFV